MIEIVGLLSLWIIQIMIILLSYTIGHRYYVDKITASIYSCFFWISTNSIVVLTTNIIWRHDFTYKNIFLTYVIYLLVLFICIKYRSEKKMWTREKLPLECRLFFLGIIILALIFLFSTDGFMPIYGNVDENAHYEWSIMWYQRLFFDNNAAIEQSNILLKGVRIPLSLDRYTYLYGYHYICALLSRMFFVDVIYINHAVRSISMAGVVCIPISYLKNKKLIIPYIFSCAFSSGTWYRFLSSGFSPQLFSVFLLYLFFYIIQNDSQMNKNKIILLFICAFEILLSYPLTGICSLVIYVVFIIKEKRMCGLVYLLLGMGLYCATPAMVMQIRNTIQGMSDEAISATSPLQEPLYIFVSLILCLIIYSVKDIKDSKDNNYYFIVIAIIFLVTFFMNNTGYLIYKMWLTSMLVFYVWGLNVFYSIVESKKKLFAIESLAIVIVYLLAVRYTYEYKGITNIVCVDSMVEKREYNAFKYIARNYEADFGIEYINIQGPHIRQFYVVDRKRPYSIFGKENEHKYAFCSESAATFERFIRAILLRQETCNQTNSQILFVVNHSKIDFDEEVFDKYGFYFNDCHKVYEEDDVSIYDCDMNNDYQIRNYDQEELESIGFYSKELVSLGIRSLVKDEEAELDIEVDNSNKACLIIDGRAIHDSKISIIKNSNGEIKTEVIEKFEGLYVADISGCDSVTINFEKGNISDAIAISDIWYCY